MYVKRRRTSAPRFVVTSLGVFPVMAGGSVLDDMGFFEGFPVHRKVRLKFLQVSKFISSSSTI